MFHPVYNWRFKTEPEPGMNGREIYWPSGRTLGGSSAINGLIYIRGHRDDYDHWAALGNHGLGLSPTSSPTSASSSTTSAARASGTAPTARCGYPTSSRSTSSSRR